MTKDDWTIPSGTTLAANFPWLRTCDGHDQLDFEISISKDILTVYSRNCYEFTSDGDTCHPCTRLYPQIYALITNAKECKPHTRDTLLTPVQLVDRLNETHDLVNKLKLVVRQSDELLLSIY